MMLLNNRDLPRQDNGSGTKLTTRKRHRSQSCRESAGYVRIKAIHVMQSTALCQTPQVFDNRGKKLIEWAAVQTPSFLPLHMCGEVRTTCTEPYLQLWPSPWSSKPTLATPYCTFITRRDTHVEEHWKREVVVLAFQSPVLCITKICFQPWKLIFWSTFVKSPLWVGELLQSSPSIPPLSIQTQTASFNSLFVLFLTASYLPSDASCLEVAPSTPCPSPRFSL